MFCEPGILALCIFQLVLCSIVLLVLFPLFLLQIYAERQADRVGQIPYFVHRACAFGAICDLGNLLISISDNKLSITSNYSIILILGIILYRIEFCLNLAFASYYLLIHLNWVKKVNDRTSSTCLLFVYRLSVFSLFLLELTLTCLSIVLNSTWPDGVRGCYEIILLLLLWVGFCYTQTTMGKISRASHERVRTNRNSISRSNMEAEHSQTIRKIYQTLVGVFCLLVIPVPILGIRAAQDFQNTGDWRMPRGDYISAFIDLIRVLGYSFALWYAWLPLHPTSNTMDQTKMEVSKPRLELQSMKSLRPSISVPPGRRFDSEIKQDISITSVPSLPIITRYLRADSRLTDSVSGKFVDDSSILRPPAPSSPTLISTAHVTPSSDSPPIIRITESSLKFPSNMSQISQQYDRRESMSRQNNNSPLVSQIIPELETVAEHRKKSTTDPPEISTSARSEPE